MSRENVNYSHGDKGTKPGTALNFKSGDRPNSEYFDWWWYSVSQAVDGHAEEFTRLDSNDDGIVDKSDEADSALTYKGNDIDSDGDGSVDNADVADQAKRMEVRTSDPSTPDDGQMWIRSDL